MLTRLLAATVLSRNVAVQHETLVTNVTSKALSWALVGEQGKCRSLCAEAGCLPLRFVLGAQKAATTALWRLLIRHHPKGCGAQPNAASAWVPPFRKESHFLTEPPEHVRHSTVDYSLLYHEAGCSSRCFVDATPTYLAAPDVPKLIAAHVPRPFRSEVRFVVVLREPVSRDLSWYNHMLTDLMEHNNSNWNRKPLARYVTYEQYVVDALLAWEGCRARFGRGERGGSSGGGAVRRSMKAVFAACKDESILAIGLYAAQLERWLATWLPQSMLIINYALLESKASRVLEHLFGRSLANVSSAAGYPGPLPDDPLQGGGDCDADTDAAARVASIEAPPAARHAERAALAAAAKGVADHRPPSTAQSSAKLAPLAAAKTRLEDSLGVRDANTKSSAWKVESIACETRDALQAFFEPWNAVLYTILPRLRFDAQDLPHCTQAHTPRVMSS